MVDDASTGRKFSAVLTILGIGIPGEQEKVILDGMDISRFVKSIRTHSFPGEMMEVELEVIPLIHQRDRPALEIPEALANVIVRDTEEMIDLRIMLRDLLEIIDDDKPVGGLSGPQFHRLQNIRRYAEGPRDGETFGTYIQRRGTAYGGMATDLGRPTGIQQSVPVEPGPDVRGTNGAD